MKLLRNIRAIINRTFLADCPRCHKHFYGFHEYGTQLKFQRINYRIVCHRCAQDYKNEGIKL